MATPTVWPEFPIVNVVGAMTVRATFTGFSHGCQGAAVAVFTGNVQMGTMQLKVCLNIMVK